MRNNNFSIKFYCEACQTYHMSKEVLYEFYEIAENFVILLDKCINTNTNTFVTTLNIAFEIQETIDLSNYMTNKNQGSIYKLTGIVSYDPSDKNYVCFSKSFLDKEWYLYSDEKVEKRTPLLSKIPLLGWLFKSKEKNSEFRQQLKLLNMIRTEM